MDQFDIKKFLTENKVTIASQRLEEADSYGMPGSSVVKEKKSGGSSSAPKAPKAPKASGESKPKAEGEEEDSNEVDSLMDQFKELSKDQKVAFAKEVAKALKPKPKKEKEEDSEEEEEIDEELKGGQKKLDKDGDGKISGKDFQMMKK